MKTEAHIAFYYVCPTCNAENTVRVIDNPLVQSGFTCKGCKTKRVTNDLYASWKTIFPTPDKYHPNVVEYICDCGKTNIIFAKLIKSETKDANTGDFHGLFDDKNDWKIKTETYEEVTLGICEDCGTEHELEYPLPQSFEVYLKEKGFPFDGTVEERQKWLEENEEN